MSLEPFSKCFKNLINTLSETSNTLKIYQTLQKNKNGPLISLILTGINVGSIFNQLVNCLGSLGKVFTNKLNVRAGYIGLMNS